MLFELNENIVGFLGSLFYTCERMCLVTGN